MSDDQTAGPFLHRKYDADRVHELELNKFTHALEMDRLKLLLLLNGGAFTVVGGFSESLFRPGATSPILFAAMGAWLVGLLLAAFATQDALNVQRAFAQAYHNRRRATEWRILGETDPPVPGATNPATDELPTLPPRVPAEPVAGAVSTDDPATNIAAFNQAATAHRAGADRPATRVTWLAWLSVFTFAIGGLALLAGLSDLPPPPAKPDAPQAGSASSW